VYSFLGFSTVTWLKTT